MAGHFIVCGMGHVSYRVVVLLRRLGESVTVITQQARDAFVVDDRVLIILSQRVVGQGWHGVTPSQLRAQHGVNVLMRQRLGERGYALGYTDVPLEKEETILTVAWRTLSA